MPSDRSPSPAVPSPARMYDYFLHGDNNFPVDRAAGDVVMSRVGAELTRSVVWENRRFLGRAVEFLAAECGVRQFIDVGAGLPSNENTHQVARRFAPDARVLYVDNDPVVAQYGRERFTGEEAANVRFATADLREPETILEHPARRELIDFTQPVGVLFVAVFHFVRDEDGPGRIAAAFRGRLCPGSYVALSHLSTDGSPQQERQAMQDSYRDTSAPMVFRERAAIMDLFGECELVPPGLVQAGLWRPDERATELTNRMLAGVGHKRR